MIAVFTGKLEYFWSESGACMHAGPVMYGFIWFAVFGGAGLRMERQAANLGVDCFVGPDPTGVPDETGTIPEITQFRWVSSVVTIMSLRPITCVRMGR